MAESFRIDTSTWRLPPRSARPRIDLPGVEDLEVSAEGIRAKDTISSVIDTASWTLPKKEAVEEKPKPLKKKRAPGEPGPKDKGAPRDDHGRPALFGGVVGVHSEDVRHELRRLAGLERSEHIEFATGTPHRRMPDDRRFEITEERLEPTVFQPEADRVVMTDEMRRLCGMAPASSLPHAVHDAASMRRYHGVGMLDEDSKSGEQFVEEVLRQSRGFFRDFTGLPLEEVSPLGEAPGGRRTPWRGNDDEEPPPWVMDALPGETVKDTGEAPKKAPPGAAPPEGGEPEEVPPEGEEPEAEPEEPEAEPEEEPPPEGEEPEEDEEEEVAEAREGPGALGRVGGLLKRAGAHISGSKTAQRAKERVTGRIHKAASAFAKKHGIDTGKFHGTSDSGELKRLSKVKAAKPSLGSRISSLRQRAAGVARRARPSLIKRLRPAKRLKVRARK